MLSAPTTREQPGKRKGHPHRTDESDTQMNPKSKRGVLSFVQLRDGYIKTIENAIRFFGASTDLIQVFPDKALALGQLGQEEVGRSLSLLAAFSLPSETHAWEWFWKGWNNH